MQISIDYRSFYNLQVEMRNLDTPVISKVEYDGKTYEVTSVMYLEPQKQLRLMVNGTMGETRLFNVSPNDFKITQFFVKTW